MHRNSILTITFSLLLATAQAYGATASEDSDPNVRSVLDELAKRTSQLQSYQCDLDYVFKQTLLGSQSRRTGMMYYAKFDDRSYLHITFTTIQQDEEPVRKAREEYFFDGVWLTYIDYELKSVEQHQMAEPNAPVDAFTLVNQHVPVVGFSQIDDLENQFEIELLAPSPSDPPASYHLHMTAKPDSKYKNNYSSVDFWIDRKEGLPTRIVAVEAREDTSPERNVHEITMSNAKMNAGLDRSVFKIDIPAGFSVERTPLRQGRTAK